jgi:hypothetical protein
LLARLEALNLPGVEFVTEVELIQRPKTP